ncbi:hypothetical protein Q0M41_13790, partial [Staphylococcus aureus]|nr:hypothetical protein [Staphylococcus aureus]
KPTVAPPPPEKPERRRGGLLATISGFLTHGVVLALGVLVGLTLLNRQASEPGPLPADKVVVIPSRSGTSEIASILAREGVIEHPSLFE